MRSSFELNAPYARLILHELAPSLPRGESSSSMLLELLDELRDGRCVLLRVAGGNAASRREPDAMNLPTQVVCQAVSEFEVLL